VFGLHTDLSALRSKSIDAVCVFFCLFFAGFSMFCLSPKEISGQNLPEQIPLWPAGATGFESRRAESEQAKDWWVYPTKEGLQDQVGPPFYA